MVDEESGGKRAEPRSGDTEADNMEEGNGARGATRRAPRLAGNEFCADKEKTVHENASTGPDRADGSGDGQSWTGSRAAWSPAEAVVSDDVEAADLL